jgi:Gliding motility associated protein GldN
VFANAEVANRFNTAQRMSFDDLFQKRMFNSYIIKEDNVYNRRIDDYRLNPLDALLESERIKQDMINFEIDLWEY